MRKPKITAEKLKHLLQNGHYDVPTIAKVFHVSEPSAHRAVRRLHASEYLLTRSVKNGGAGRPRTLYAMPRPGPDGDWRPPGHD